MSQMLGGADGGGLLYPNDARLMTAVRTGQDGRLRAVDRQLSYATPWWPPRGGFYGDLAADVGIQMAQSYGNLDRSATGGASRLRVQGTTRDANGTPISGVTCSLFRTSDRQWIMDTVSLSDGSFQLFTPFTPDQHFVVFYKAGGPVIFATTVQTIIGV